MLGKSNKQASRQNGYLAQRFAFSGQLSLRQAGQFSSSVTCLTREGRIG